MQRIKEQKQKNVQINMKRYDNIYISRGYMPAGVAHQYVYLLFINIQYIK